MTLLVIRTIERPGVDYLPELVQAVEAEGFRGVVMNDGPEPRRIDRPGWTSVATGGPLGSRGSGWRAIQIAAAAGEDLLLLEDDVCPGWHAVGAMTGWPVPIHVAFLSYFDAVYRPKVAGLLELPCARFLFAQALKIPLRTIKALALSDPLRWARLSYSQLHDFDRTLGLACAELTRLSYGLVLPNLVEHRGDVSAVVPGGRPEPIRSTWWTGWPWGGPKT